MSGNFIASGEWKPCRELSSREISMVIVFDHLFFFQSYQETNTLMRKTWGIYENP